MSTKKCGHIWVLVVGRVGAGRERVIHVSLRLKKVEKEEVAKKNLVWIHSQTGYEGGKGGGKGSFGGNGVYKVENWGVKKIKWGQSFHRPGWRGEER